LKLEEGVRVSDKVRLTRPLGRGGMGTVWAAHHEALDTEVAVKFIQLAAAADADVARFSREAKLAAQIKSPHVVQMFDHGVLDDGTPYIVMELLRGESLAQRLRREPAPTVEEVATIVDQVARALTVAHGADVVHRDIKPDNIFLVAVGHGEDQEQHVKVLDFGIARQLESDGAPLTKTGSVFGTIAYMSPEQLDDTRSVGPSTDLWALAVVAYEALTGRLPFRGESAVSLWQAMQKGEFAPPTSVMPALPALFDRWFARALDPDASRRFPAAKALAAAFRRTVNGEGESTLENAATELAAPASRPRATAPRPKRRDPMRVFLLVLVLLLVGGAITLGVLAWQDRDPPAGPL
jgi:eukaryotic-like serine/threonine-protein kinase